MKIINQFMGVVSALVFAGCSVLPPLKTSSLETPLDDSPFKSSQASSQRSPARTFDLIWPVKDGLVTQEFKASKKRRRGHKGIDIAAPRGDDVFAAHDGLVIFAGRQFRGFGKLIIIETNSGEWATFYSHLLRINIKEGQHVKQGQIIGNIGNTGRATGYHLHFEVRLNKEPLNPLTVLP